MAAKRILIVDDVRTIRTLLTVYLMGAGYEFSDAESAIEGLAMAQRDPPDLIISDVRMAEMDGFEFCRAVRSDPALSRVPFIMMTSACGDQSLPQRCKQAGAEHLLCKPLDPDKLNQAVASCLA